MVAGKGVENASQSQEWNEERMQKYRKMKRKLLDSITASSDF
jgi:hypothetical protein